MGFVSNDSSGIVAIIPARGGSKRLPGKNLLPLGGKPLIAWTIEAALNSSELSRVIVSTEDQEIAQVAKSYGAEVPFMRPFELAADTTTTIDVVIDALSKIEEYSAVALLQPTSPLRTSKHIDQAVNLYKKKKAKSVVSVCKVEHPVEWSSELPDDNCMDDFISQGLLNKRSQDLPVRYRINGAIYIADSTRVILKQKTFHSIENSFAYKMDVESSVDIDTEFDFTLAEALLNKKKAN